MTITKAIQLDAKTVLELAELGRSKIEQLREMRTASIREEWVTEENKWRSFFRFIGFRSVTEADFNVDDLPLHQRVWYYSMGQTLYKGDEDILYRLICASSLSIEKGDGLIWISSEESERLQNWRFIDLHDVQD
jgi:nucleotidyltransferase/DNA polymerase involved in DNA repair